VYGLAGLALSSPPNQCGLVATFGTAYISRWATVIVRVLEIVTQGDVAPIEGTRVIMR
jgi:hypothetical protein